MRIIDTLFIICFIILLILYQIEKDKTRECARVLNECVETIDTGMDAVRACDDYVRVAEDSGLMRRVRPN